jgi:cytidylate kinase
MPLNIAIDGPVGAGKSSIAREVARRLNILHLDTGAMYRAVGYAALTQEMPLEDENALENLCGRITIEVRYLDGRQQTLIDGMDISHLIRTPEVGMAASTVSRFRAVRSHMIALQRALARETSMVVDGRDIGTNVLPDAGVKIFLTAAPEERARRRYLEFQEAGGKDSYETVLNDLLKRDLQDTTRPIDPLRPAEDAMMLDSTHLNMDQVVKRILDIVEARYGKTKEQ